jgi:hypothetical protein
VSRGYELERRSQALGGGWKVRFFEDETEAGGGVFPAADFEGPEDSAAYHEALDAGEDWATGDEPGHNVTASAAPRAG